ncbi:hypothetical protein FRX31_020683 [Thalictrum thalictroides]|uniref:Uncharacterized protein n=1 Tax=Thalictrum thalictroides TaxID=46969 RepID=A0A7J6VZU7_THATH|nr:hypothetical protein FRX31_020683 [Thalictrum thalictroides]
MELVSPIIEIVTRLVNWSTKHLNYLRALDTNFEKLEEEMAQLNEHKSDLNNKVIPEEARLKKRTNQVDGCREWKPKKIRWLNSYLKGDNFFRIDASVVVILRTAGVVTS